MTESTMTGKVGRGEIVTTFFWLLSCIHTTRHRTTMHTKLTTFTTHTTHSIIWWISALTVLHSDRTVFLHSILCCNQHLLRTACPS